MKRSCRKEIDFKRISRKVSKVFLSLIIISYILSGCSPKYAKRKNEVIPGEDLAFSSVARIDSVLGFSFEWKFRRKKTGLMPELKAELQGKVSLPDRIFINGEWRTGKIEDKINVYSIEGKEYTYNKETKTWEGGTESSFPNPLEQLKLILSFGEFKFERFDTYNRDRCYLFRFKPNVYFIDPAEESKAVGYLWISEKENLPIRVKVSSEKDIINWDMSLSGFNSFANINVPFRAQKIRISGIQNAKKDIDLIIDRFLFLGYEKPQAKSEKNGDVIFSVNAENLSDSIIKRIVMRGDIEFFIGAWPKEPIFELREDSNLVIEKYGDGARLFFERGVVTKPIIAIRKILSRNELQSFDIKNDVLGKFSIYTHVKSQRIESLKKIIEEHIEKPVVVVVDNTAVFISFVRDTWVLENKIPVVKGIDGEESAIIFSKLKTEPLQNDYSFELLNKEE